MIDLRDASLIDFLPESIAQDSEIFALSLAIDPEMRDVGAAIIEAAVLPRIAELPETILNELGWAFRLTELTLWDTATADGKRGLLVNIFAIRKKSGTRFAVRRIFDLLSVVGSVIEWFEDSPIRPAFTYRIVLTVTDTELALATLLQIPELTNRFAPTRANLSEVAVATDRLGSLLPYVATVHGRETTIQFGGP
jgi:phage tail P2-like protein